MTTPETRTRADLAWAIRNTPLRLTPALQNPDLWEWDADDVSMSVNGGIKYRFHVAGWRSGSRKSRIAVMTISDSHGRATWEAEIPEDAE